MEKYSIQKLIIVAEIYELQYEKQREAGIYCRVQLPRDIPIHHILRLGIKFTTENYLEHISGSRKLKTNQESNLVFSPFLVTILCGTALTPLIRYGWTRADHCLPPASFIDPP